MSLLPHIGDLSFAALIEEDIPWHTQAETDSLLGFDVPFKPCKGGGGPKVGADHSWNKIEANPRFT